MSDYKQYTSPDFTVVIPVYNRPTLVTRALDSVAVQSLRPGRLIVVDNNSTDSTPAVLRQWADRHQAPDSVVDIRSCQTPGVCAARNLGLKDVTSPYVLFFDSDDTMRPRLIERYAAAFAANPEAQISATAVCLHNLDGSSRVMKVKPRGFDVGHFSQSWLRTQGYAVRTDYLRRCGGWDETLPAWNDFELGVRLLLPAPQIAVIPEVNVDIYAQPQSITGTDFSSRAHNLELALTRIEQDIRNYPDAPAKYLGLVDLRRAILAALYAREGAKDKADALMESTLRSQSSLRRRLLVNMAYSYTRLHLRGACRLFSMFL